MARPGSTMFTSALTQFGSNCEPAQSSSSRRAAACVSRGRYGRFSSIAEVRVGDRDDPSGERDLLGGEALWVAAAVPAFVVRAHDLGDLGLDDRSNHSLALDWMLVDLAPLVGGQWARLREDPFVDEQLPDVVQQSSLDDGATHPLTEREAVRQLVGARRDRDRMPVRVALLAGQRGDDPSRCLDRKPRFCRRLGAPGRSHGLPLSGDAQPILPLQ